MEGTESRGLKAQLFWTGGHYEHPAFVAVLVAMILFPVTFRGRSCFVSIGQMEKSRQR